jgi:hypothetical protein
LPIFKKETKKEKKKQRKKKQKNKKNENSQSIPIQLNLIIDSSKMP